MIDEIVTVHPWFWDEMNRRDHPYVPELLPILGEFLEASERGDEEAQKRASAKATAAMQAAQEALEKLDAEE